MKKLIIEDENEGLLALLGERITIYCDTFIYTGKLVGVNDYCVKLDEAKLVYDTGAHSSSSWADAEDLPTPWYVTTSKIESFGVWK